MSKKEEKDVITYPVEDVIEIIPNAIQRYGMEVIKNRALPNIISGLKPVQQRILFAMSNLGCYSNKPFIKSARIVGEVMGKHHPHGNCLEANTIIFGLDGTYKTIKELYDSKVPFYDVLAYDSKTGELVPAKAHSFRIGQYSNKNYKITLFNGSEIICTGNHPFLTTDGEWIKAEKITKLTTLYTATAQTDKEYRFIKHTNNMNRIPIYHISKAFECVEDKMIRHHINHNKHDDRPENIAILSRAEHALLHKHYSKGLNKGRQTMFGGGEYSELIKKKNQILCDLMSKTNLMRKVIYFKNWMLENDYEFNAYNFNDPKIRAMCQHDSRWVSNYGLVRTLPRWIDIGFTFNVTTDDILKYNDPKDFKMDTSAAKGLTAEIRERLKKVKPKNDNQNYKIFGVYHSMVKVILFMIKNNYELDWVNYEKARICLADQIMNKGEMALIKSHKIPDMLTKKTLIDIITFLSNLNIISVVKKVEIIECDNEPMYDFTVDGYENALIMIRDDNGTKQCIVAHNSSIYGALANMALDFKCGVQYIDPNGNFGTRDADSPSAERYCCVGDTFVEICDNFDSNQPKYFNIPIFKLMSLGEIDDDGNIDFSFSCGRYTVKGIRNSKTEYVPFDKIIVSGIHEIYKAEVVYDSIDGYKMIQSIKGTPNHPILIDVNGNPTWKRMDEIESGDVLWNPDGKKYVIDTCYKLDQKLPVYSLRVNTIEHAYYTNFFFISHNTEARLHQYAEKVFLPDLNPDIVEYENNFDDTLKEPKILPAILPNILINPNVGIAVGLACSFVPHNPREVIDLLLAYLEDRNLTLEDAMNYLKAPDFPTYGTINGLDSIKKAYSCGNGYVRLRGAWKIEEDKKGNTSIIITELPYGVVKNSVPKKKSDGTKTAGGVVQKILGCGITREIEIKDVQDLSDRNGMCIKVDLKKDEDPDRVINVLLTKCDLESNINIMMWALDVNGVPQQYDLMRIIKEFVSFREEVIHKRLLNEKKKHEDRLHIIEGLFIINKDLDKCIKLVRNAEGKADAINKIMKAFKLSEIQATYICNLQLYRLSKTDMAELKEENDKLTKRVKAIVKITRSKSNKDMDEIMRNEWLELKNGLFKNSTRKTKIMAKHQKLDKEQNIKDEPCSLIISKNGYIKRTSLISENVQHRAGSGISYGLAVDDELLDIINTRTIADILAITNTGRTFVLKPYTLDEVARTARGKLAKNIFNLKDGETIVLYQEVDRTKNAKDFIMTLSQNGMVKSTKMEEIENINSSGKKLVGLQSKDKIVGAVIVNKSDNVLITTRDGNSIRFKVTDVKPTGTGAIGVIGVNLSKDDKAISIVKVNPGDEIVFISSEAYVKKVDESEFKVQSRGGYGVVTCPKTEGYGHLVASMVPRSKTITIITKMGKSLTCDLSQIRKTARNRQGTRGIKLQEGDSVVSIC